MKEKRVLAVCSGGGHLEQLLCIKECLGNAPHLCSTVDLDFLTLGFKQFYKVQDCNQNNLISTLKCFLQLIFILIKIRPSVILSTGAAPGILAIFIGRFIGAKTIWIDSVANAETLSLSGKVAGKIAHVWLTQWPQLAKEDGPQYWGNIF
jgi:UDP-N-acetylglucosamine:LPS N-acetylglucosamine transferase